MFSREYRLPATVRLKSSRYIRTELFAVKYAPNNLTIARFAFVAGKSVDKRAVVRNRIKRVFRSCIEELREQISPGYDMLFFLEKGIIEVTREDLFNRLKNFFIERHLIIA
jgi:ribonuclease P protein component